MQERLTQHGEEFGEDPTQDGVRKLTRKVGLALGSISLALRYWPQGL